jgi:uncharacterized protein (DUF2147 family)
LNQGNATLPVRYSIGRADFVCNLRRQKMMKSLKHMLQVAAFASVAVGAGPAFAADPTGIWYDHTGRGAVEIVKCGSNLCGKLVWLKNASHKEGPQDQIQRRADAYESQVAEGRRLPRHEVLQ